MNKDNYTYEVIKRTNQFSVSILSEQINPNVIAALGFASGRDTDKFDGIGAGMIHDLPILSENCCGYMICGVVSMLETSTHFVILAKVRDAFGSSALPPMTYKVLSRCYKGKGAEERADICGRGKEGRVPLPGVRLSIRGRYYERAGQLCLSNLRCAEGVVCAYLAFHKIESPGQAKPFGVFLFESSV